VALFLDANIPIYVAGRPHPLQAPCTRILELVAHQPQAFLTNAEVLQELLHRYLSLRRWPEGQQIIEGFARLMQGHIEPITAADVLGATALAEGHPGLSARDLLHVAVLRRVGAAGIITADARFESVAGLRRFDPAQLDTWLAEMVG